jgi:methanogenic corrinoid protein MtbC1
MTQVKSGLLSLLDIEQRSGLSRDVLRKWELRYQFPNPHRGPRGQRLFTEGDAVKLTLVRKLLGRGMRPRALVSLSLAQLQTLWTLRDPCDALPAAPTSLELAQAVQSLLDTLTPARDPRTVAFFLQKQIALHGLAVFAAHHLPAFNLAVGQAWLSRTLSVAAEHRYTSSLQQVVLRALPAPGAAHTGPCVLLTTPPGELHGLGLLALQAQLCLQGACCVDLGTQTPVAEVLRAARELKVGVVAISASSALSPDELRSYLRELTQGLPAGCAVWAGGQGCSVLSAQELAGCEVFNNTSEAVARWMAFAKTSCACSQELFHST